MIRFQKFDIIYQKLLSNETKKRSERIILVIAIASFLIHLAIICLVDFGIVSLNKPSDLLKNPIAAIYTPFSFILVYEVYLLIYYLPKSITTYISKLLAVVWGILARRYSMLLSIFMLIVCLQLPLLTSFGLYFIGQHSLTGWSHLKQGLNTDNLSLFLKALPFTLGAFLLFSIMLFSLERGWLTAFNGNWITAFFVFISCISFPHVIAMHGFYRKHFAKL